MSRAAASCEHRDAETNGYIANALWTRDFEPDALPIGCWSGCVMLRIAPLHLVRGWPHTLSGLTRIRSPITQAIRDDMRR